MFSAGSRIVPFRRTYCSHTNSVLKFPLDIATICGYIYTVVGRPPKPPNERRDKPLRIRLSPGERALLDQAAAQAGQGTSAWAREVLLAVAAQKAPTDRPDIQSSENR